jgi:hypothetical protein
MDDPVFRTPQPGPRLRRFWFEFSPSDRLTCLNMGCGVTAFDYDDALYLLKNRVLESQLLDLEDLPIVSRVVEDVDVSQLDAAHVLPNMGLVTERGVWFPLGL